MTNGNDATVTNAQFNTVPLVNYFEIPEDHTLTDVLQGYDRDTVVDTSGLNWKIITYPDSGTYILTDPIVGSFTYTPIHNYNGIDILGFSVYDDGLHADSTLTFINVIPVNDAPVTKPGATGKLNLLTSSSVLGSITNEGHTISSIFSTNTLGSDVDIPHYINFSDVTGMAIISVTDLGPNKWKYCLLYWAHPPKLFFHPGVSNYKRLQ